MQRKVKVCIYQNRLYLASTVYLHYDPCMQFINGHQNIDIYQLLSFYLDCIVFRDYLKKINLFSGESGSGWMMNRLKDGSKFYYNTKSKTYKWSRPDGVVKDHGQLNKEEIQVSHAGLRRKANTVPVWKFK